MSGPLHPHLPVCIDWSCPVHRPLYLCSHNPQAQPAKILVQTQRTHESHSMNFRQSFRIRAVEVRAKSSNWKSWAFPSTHFLTIFFVKDNFLQYYQWWNRFWSRINPHDGLLVGWEDSGGLKCVFLVLSGILRRSKLTSNPLWFQTTDGCTISWIFLLSMRYHQHYHIIKGLLGQQ